MKYLLAALALLAALVWGTWLIVVPRDMIQSRLEGSLSTQGLKVQTKGLRKGLFYSLNIEALDITKNGEVLLSVYDISVVPDWSSLIHLRAGARFSGELGGGRLTGRGSSYLTGQMSGKLHALSLKARDVQLEMLNMEAITGQSIEGLLKADLNLSGQEGAGTMSIRDMIARDITIQGFTLPESFFHTARGAFKIKGDTLDITSLALEGQGIFARIKGSIDPQIADIKVELMPESREVDMLLSAALGRYKSGKGLYIIPVKQNLSH